MSDGCRAAVDAALRVLESGGEPVDAAVAGVVVLEDDPRYNAGTGSRVRIDGVTVQMDAAVMTSAGRFGGVAAIEQVKNPVCVARAVLDTPHLLLAGDGATRFARTLGMPPYDPTTDDGRARARDLQKRLLARDPTLPAEWARFDWRRHWNFEHGLSQGASAGSAGGSGQVPADGKVPAGGKVDAGSDTVGVAVRAADGRFGVALSTGGTALTLRGRVGDVPIPGAGLFAGVHGAVAATGTGERIIDVGLARHVYDWLAAGIPAEQAAKRAVDLVGGKNGSIIVMSPTAMSAATESPMAWAARESGASTWLGPGS
ncbi:isoaspartyl peptidase/L-asparaginase [Pendulispora albinea]|uniref:Isoaspartyl peptidase/L-asparaginase n=1 Tax=Pendulispora albinea TaxID=2741071 RepID=A0ABZ2M3L5_9BACT